MASERPIVSARNYKSTLAATFSIRPFSVIWLSTFLTTVASFSLLLSLTSFVFDRTQSVFVSSLVFVSQWVLAAVSPSLISYLSARRPIISLLALAELLSAVTIGMLAILHAYLSADLFVFLIVVLLVPRGFFESLNKSLRVVPVKGVVPHEYIRPAVAYLGMAQFIATACGSLVGLYLYQTVGLTGVLLSTCLAFVLSAALLNTLSGVEVARQNRDSASLGLRRYWGSVFRVLKRQNGLLEAFVYLSACTALYQGYHTAGRSAYASQYLALPETGPMLVQFAASMAIIAGAGFYAAFNAHLRDRSISASLFMATAAAIFLTYIPGMPIQMLAQYALFIFIWEIGFMHFQTGMIARCDGDEVALINSASVATMNTGMAIVALGAAYLADVFSLFSVGAVILVLAAMVVLAMRLSGVNSQRR